MGTVPVRHHHVSLSVLDLDRQRSWYREHLGFTETLEELDLRDPPVRTVVLATADGLRLELIERRGVRARSFSDPLEAASEQGVGHWALEVGDLDAAWAQLTDGGAAPVWPPAPAARPGDRFAYVKDPEGNLLELIEPSSA